MSENQNIYDPGRMVKNKKRTMWIWIGVIVGITILVIVLCAFAWKNIKKASGEETYSSPYIAKLHVEGTIQETEEGYFASGETYDHQWTLKKIGKLAKDKNNKGIILFVNSPGGGVYESDELYYKLKEYKEKTGRPVYSYMGSMAASGGYYISAPCDKIYANRNCWTGSIGVTIGTLYDVSGFLEKHGVKTVTITSGENKAMGGYTDPVTKEQRAIFQSLVDEAYDQFVGIVASGRKMDEKRVRKLADGRIYTAKQAKSVGLVDGVMSLKSCVKKMKEDEGLTDCEVQDIKHEVNYDMWTFFLSRLGGAGAIGSSDISDLKALMGENNTFKVTYMCNIEK